MVGFKSRTLLGMVAAVLAALALPYGAGAAPPANDDFDGAKLIASLPFSDTVNVTELSLASDDPTPCSFFSNKSAWYKLTPAANQRVTFATTAPAMIPLDLFTGTQGNLQRVACTRLTNQQELRADLVAGTTYYLMILPGSGWEIDLTVTAELAPPGPANDDFDSATEIASHDFHDSVDTIDAIASLDDPVVCGQSYLANTVWYRWTATGKRRVTIDTSGSVWPYQPRFDVYTGTRGALTQPPGSCFTSEFDAEAGKTYYFMFGSQFGAGVLDLSFSAKGFSDVSLDVSRNRLVYGKSVRLSGHVTAISDPSGDTVSIYRRTSLGSVSRFLVGTALVDAGGDFSLELKPDRNWFYDAEWAGDDESLSDVSATRSVKVAPRLNARLYRFHHTAGGYKIYQPGKTPLYVVTIDPHLRAEIGVRVQVKRDGVWKRYASGAFGPNEDGIMAVAIDGLAVGTPYRIKALYFSDGYHLNVQSSWAYLKVVR